jgi:hypothetical protein
MNTVQNQPQTPSHALSMPNLLLRAEGLVIFVTAIVLYAHLRGSAVLFGVLLLAPDLAMLGYLHSVRLGSMLYNAVHTVTVPVILALIGLALNETLIVQIALIWLAHIGMDRMVGYGLKYATQFKDTHMNRV